jgi:TRAP-type C4-dicarboxylate transport system permease small subunit
MIVRILRVYCVFCAILTCLAVFFITCSRYFFHINAPWIDEVAMLAMVNITFVGGALAVRDNTHLRINIMPMLLRGNSLWLGELLVAIMAVVVSALFTYLSWDHLWYLIRSGQQLPGLRILWAIGFAAIPIGATFMTFYAAAVTVAHVRKGVPNQVHPDSARKEGEEGSNG